MSRGHTLSESDIACLQTMNIPEVTVLDYEPGEISESEAAIRIIQQAVCGSLEFQVQSGGSVAGVATDDCCVIVDVNALTMVNNTPGGVQIATRPNFSFAAAGHKIVTAKSTPFVASARAVDEQQVLIGFNPLLQARPISGTVAVIYTHPVTPSITESMFYAVARTRLARCNIQSFFSSCVSETPESIAAEIAHWSSDPRVSTILIASPTVPAGLSDPVGQGMLLAQCSIESFMAPVDPGSLLILGYYANLQIGHTVSVVAAPGCWRQPKPNVLDIILPALLSRYRFSAFEISSLGIGGLLQ